MARIRLDRGGAGGGATLDLASAMPRSADPTSPATPAAWSPDSWRACPTEHQPEYPLPEEAARVVGELASLPPLVSSLEVEQLREELAEAAEGRRFLLQGGDCAERFEGCRAPRIASQLKMLLQAGLVIGRGAGVPVIRVGRLGGQYAKPRTEPFERSGEVELPSFFGDLVNRPAFSAEARTPDPALLLEGYARAALTVNFIRALIDGGFGDLRHPEWWSLDLPASPPMLSRWQDLVAEVRRAGCGGGADPPPAPVFTSREGLLLAFEAAQTREVPRRRGWWNLSTHFPWIGVRTLRRGGGHVEYFRGIANPIALKVGPATPLDDLPALLETLDPERQPGRLTVIHRFGAAEIARRLPAAIAAVERSGRRVLWSLDPMHGNTELVPIGDRRDGAMVKTRRVERILEEIARAAEIHARCGTPLGGIHLEMAPEPIAECLGGSEGVDVPDLARDYRSPVDPRLNYGQALEVAFAVADALARAGRGTATAAGGSDPGGTAESPLDAGDRNRTCMGCPTGT
jgi:3-deoxy-7-phosphoheptulonate synthase